MNELVLLILGMAFVTYLPRMLPMVAISNLNLPPYWERFLGFIPYTVLSALLFPEILFSTANVPSAVVGGLLATFLALLKVNLLIIVVSGIGGVLVYEVLV